MYELHLHYSDGRVVRVALEKTINYIGRDAGCEVALEDSITSRRHARLYRDGSGHWWIEDLHSKNGTTLNDQEITTARVREGDRIGIGSSYLTLHPAQSEGIVLSEIETKFGSTSVWRSDQRISLPQQRLEKLYELNERITGHFDRDELLNELMDICMEALRFDRGGVALWAGDPNPPQWVAMRNPRPGPEGEFRISRSIVQRALHRGERILVNDVSSDLADPTASMISNNICSAMCVPLVYHERVHGVLYGDRTTPSAGYTKEDVDFFAALGRQAAMALANVRLLEEKQRREKMEMQLQWARQIQNRLFPVEPLVHRGVSIEAINDPGQQVSGDYYDYFVRPDGRVVAVVADVAGKGVPASLLMANLQAAVHVTMVEQQDLVKCVKLLNRLVCRNVDTDRFITGVFGLIDPQARTFSFVNAGHPAPLCAWPDGRVQALTCETRFPLGVMPETDYQIVEWRFEPGVQNVFLYTDGVPDAENEHEEHFSDARVVEALKGCAADAPRDQITKIRRLVQQFTRHHPQIDDITMMTIQVR